MNIKQIAVLVGISVAICVGLYFLVGVGMTLVGVACYIVGNFVPFKTLWALVVKGVAWINNAVEPKAA